VAREIEHDAPGELDQVHRPQIRDRAQQVLVELAEEERPVAPLEADLVIVDDHGRRHRSVSAGRRCLGRRRYPVLGISTFGGLAGIGLRTLV
jgi:hypothetical protein